jgi:hypothetical protein
MFPHDQSGYFSGDTSGRRPVWNLFGIPNAMIDVGHGFPQSVHMNVGVVFEYLFTIPAIQNSCLSEIRHSVLIPFDRVLMLEVEKVS